VVVRRLRQFILLPLSPLFVRECFFFGAFLAFARADLSCLSLPRAFFSTMSLSRRFRLYFFDIEAPSRCFVIHAWKNDCCRKIFPCKPGRHISILFLTQVVFFLFVELIYDLFFRFPLSFSNDNTQVVPSFILTPTF